MGFRRRAISQFTKGSVGRGDARIWILETRQDRSWKSAGGAPTMRCDSPLFDSVEQTSFDKDGSLSDSIEDDRGVCFFPRADEHVVVDCYSYFLTTVRLHEKGRSRTIQSGPLCTAIARRRSRRMARKKQRVNHPLSCVSQCVERGSSDSDRV